MYLLYSGNNFGYPFEVYRNKDHVYISVNELDRGLVVNDCSDKKIVNILSKLDNDLFFKTSKDVLFHLIQTLEERIKLTFFQKCLKKLTFWKRND